MRISECLFSGDIKNLILNEIEEGFKDVPSFEIEDSINIMDMFINNNICSSKREIREFLNSGAITINGEKVTDENLIINKDMAIENKIIIIRRGKKKYYMGKFVK